LKSATEPQKKGLVKNAALPKSLSDAMLLLGEVYLDAGEMALAVVELDPIAESMKENKPKELDKPTLRASLAAVRAYVGVKDMAKADGVATLLFEIGEDVPQINRALLDFAQMVKANFKGAQAAVTLAEGKNDSAAMEKAKADLAANKQLLGKLLAQLAPRKEQSLASMLFIADTCAELELNKEAREEYELILEKAKDPAWIGPNGKALTRVRAQLVGLLRMEKKYEQALTEVDVLIKENPRSLEPMMERGRILQDWSEVDAKKFPEAVGQWTRLRTLMQPMRQKPPEYFEVVYNASYCLFSEAQQQRDKEKAKQAEQVLKSTLVLNGSRLDQNTKAKYQVLLEKTIRFQGRDPNATPPAAAAPAQAAN
jgi:tetratricopeptide (TPR) repeat protein